MELKFVEAGQGTDSEFSGNWGKFAIGRWSVPERNEPTRYPGCEGQQVVSLRGNGAGHVWIFDLATGEAALFRSVDRFMAQKLSEHEVLVCPLFEPFVNWLGMFAHLHPGDWWETLPRNVVLPDAPFSFLGYRRRVDELEHRAITAEAILTSLVLLHDHVQDPEATEAAWTMARSLVADQRPELTDALKEQRDDTGLAAGTAIRCPVCGWVSRHPKDIAEGYCGHCHEWTSPRADQVSP